MDHLELLESLQSIDFQGKGEAFVESRFLTPLLECLGYESHRDYEVIRHGDENAGFKLHYPPVEGGAVRVKHYNPDYMPTIRKKAFWIIEAKSPKDVTYPFDAKYLVQGFQYCIHPEIQAKYLVVSNGLVTAIYDAHGSVFLGKDMYAPVTSFKASELKARWPELSELLSVEKLRTRIEQDLKSMFDKLALSSLDKSYPNQLLHRVGSDVRNITDQIDRRVIKLKAEAFEADIAAWKKIIDDSRSDQIYRMMDFPLRAGGSEGEYFVFKAIAEGQTEQTIFERVVTDFADQSIFRQEQTYVAVCVLFCKTSNAALKTQARDFLLLHKESDLPLRTQVECTLLRVVRKIAVISMYPELRAQIAEHLKSAPELVRFVRPASALDMTYVVELLVHRKTLAHLRTLLDAELQQWLDEALKLEAGIEDDYQKSRRALKDNERQLGGLDVYGLGGKHYSFRNIYLNFGIDKLALPSQ